MADGEVANFALLLHYVAAIDGIAVFALLLHTRLSLLMI